MSYATIHNKLHRGQLLVLDGGTGTELERRGVPMDSQAWCGVAAADNLDALHDIQLDYLHAGADIITTNTYASSRLLLEPAGFADQFHALNCKTVEAAHKARATFNHSDKLIAGSLSHRIPIADGLIQSDSRHAPSTSELAAACNEMAQLLLAQNCDLILLEMMYHPERMRPAFDAAVKTGLPVWAGFSARRGDNGEVLSFTQDADIPFAEIVKILEDYSVDVAGIMHTSADVTADALAILSQAFSGPLMAYPDSGYFVSPHWQFQDIISPPALVEFAGTWVDNGVQILGGCCGLSPRHIEAYQPLVTAHNSRPRR